MEYKNLFMMNEFSEIIKYHNNTLDRIKRFREEYPYLIAPNVYDMLQHNLKENVTILFREMSGIQNPGKKKYEKKYVCRICHKVHMIKLPGGICDECRSKYGEDAEKVAQEQESKYSKNNGKKEENNEQEQPEQ